MRNELINILCVHILISSILREGGCITVLSIDLYTKKLQKSDFQYKTLIIKCNIK